MEDNDGPGTPPHGRLVDTMAFLQPAFDELMFAGAAVAGWLGLASAAGILTAAEADIYSCVTLNEKSPMLTISKRR